MIDHPTGLDKQVRTLRKRSIFTLFLTWLALFFTIIGIAAGYKNFLRVHDKAKQAQDDAKVAMALVPQMASKVSIENWQREIRSQLIANQLQSSKELTELKSLKTSNVYLETTLKQQVEQLTRQQRLSDSQQSNVTVKPEQHWQIAEVRYLLKIASQHLLLNSDANTAIAALKTADRGLISLSLPTLLPLRNLVAKDIAKLQEYESVDLGTIIVAIDDLAKQLELKTNTETSLSASDSVDISEPKDGSLEKSGTLLNRMKARFDETVVIKRYDNKLAKRIKGDTQQVRYELIRLKLETLKLLALKSQPKAYQDQLKQLSDLLNQEHTDLLDDSVLSALTELETLDIQTELPTLLAEQYLDELLKSPPPKVQP